MFDQRWILWGLPLVILPVLIHLLNRLRYRKKEWAAMSFLLKATRHSTRQAKLRQFLILAMRMLAILFLILALSLPKVGGWVGLALSAPPDTIIVLFDRSASMENSDAGSGKTNRESALALITGALKQNPRANVVLIENVLNKPTVITADALPELTLSEPTDTEADPLKMFDAAIEYMLANQTGKTEVWVASDVQRSNWQPDDGRWETVAQQLNRLSETRGVQIRLLALQNLSETNRAVGLDGVMRFRSLGKSFVDLHLVLRRAPLAKKVIPVKIELEGKSVEEIQAVAEANELYLRKRLELPSGTGASWGRISIPDDDNLVDNVAYFVFGEDLTTSTAIFCEDVKTKALMRLAAAPAPKSLKQNAQTLAPEKLLETDLTDFSLVIWQGSLPVGDEEKALLEYVEKGGMLLCLPARGQGGSLGEIFSWGDVGKAPSDEGFSLSHWDTTRGPLADSLEGKSLPLTELSTSIRRVPIVDGRIFAEFSDGTPLLAGTSFGAGYVYGCATLPNDQWSNLGEGPVLVPMVQRMIRAGSGRLSTATMDISGRFQPEPGEEWIPLGDDASKNVRWTAGAYKNGTRLIALNRGEAEDLPTKVEPKELEKTFSGIPFRVFAEKQNNGDKALPSEAWRFMLYVMLGALLLETLLCMPGKLEGEE